MATQAIQPTLALYLSKSHSLDRQLAIEAAKKLNFTIVECIHEAAVIISDYIIPTSDLPVRSLDNRHMPVVSYQWLLDSAAKRKPLKWIRYSPALKEPENADDDGEKAAKNDEGDAKKGQIEVTSTTEPVISQIEATSTTEPVISENLEYLSDTSVMTKKRQLTANGEKEQAVDDEKYNGEWKSVRKSKRAENETDSRLNDPHGKNGIERAEVDKGDVPPGIESGKKSQKKKNTSSSGSGKKSMKNIQDGTPKSRIWPKTANRSTKTHISLTGFNKSEKAKIARNLGRIDGVVISNSFNPDLTEAIVIKKSCTRKDRTIKVLEAIVYGMWVLNQEWVEDSIAEGRILEKVKYETDIFPGASRSRLAHMEDPRTRLMDIAINLSYISSGDSNLPVYRRWVKKIAKESISKAMADVWLVSKPLGREIFLSEELFPEPRNGDGSMASDEFAREGANFYCKKHVVTIDWLLECISLWELVPYEKFEVQSIVR